METIEWKIDAETVGLRLDIFLSDNCQEITRSYVQRIIVEGGVTINKTVCLTKNYRLRIDDTVEMIIPEPIELDVLPEAIELDIYYEDAHVLVVNKPQGMVVHPAPGNYSGTLVNALLYHIQDLSSINGVIRPGIVHRIDKDTSGLLMIAKTDVAHKALAEDLKTHAIERRYVALVHGIVKTEQGTIHLPIGRHPQNRLKMAVLKTGGRDAITHYKLLHRYEGSKMSLLEMTLETGRTHQIRVHLAHMNHPIVCDPVYGLPKEKIKHSGQLLHAAILGFTHPVSGQWMQFEAPLPDYFTEVLNLLK